MMTADEVFQHLPTDGGERDESVTVVCCIAAVALLEYGVDGGGMPPYRWELTYAHYGLQIL